MSKFEKRWISVRVPEIESFDISDITLTQLNIFHLNMQQKYPDYTFCLMCDYDCISLYAKRMETDVEVERRKAKSTRMRQFWLEKNMGNNTTTESDKTEVG